MLPRRSYIICIKFQIETIPNTNHIKTSVITLIFMVFYSLLYIYFKTQHHHVSIMNLAHKNNELKDKKIPKITTEK